ncbi:phytoene desaturase family protein [Endothiovibrio diazotrophicus]
MSAEARYDTIVIGSGIGGLTAAALLARGEGQRVLVLERHWLAGGQTHVFRRRGGYRWDVGLHYVGDLAPGSELRAVMDYVTDGQVRWQRQPGGVDRFHYPGRTLRTGEGADHYRAELEAAFPGERAGIARYFADLERAGRAARLHWAAALMPRPLAIAMAGWKRCRYGDLLGTTGAWLERHIDDPALRALLVSQWGDYGLPPARSAFLTHAQIASHFLHGAWYPVGGAGRLAQAIVPLIEAAGGRLQTHTAVERIVVEGGTVRGVEAWRFRRSGALEERWQAPRVISAAGAHATYHRLLADQPLERERREAEALAADAGSAVTLYLGLNDDPARHGFSGENHWLYSGLDHDRAFADGDALLRGEAAYGFLSFPSVKDPEAGAPTAEVVAICPWQPFARWAEHPWRHRGEAYQALKERIAEGLLDLVERHFPGFRRLVAYRELSTPLTLADFTGHHHGGFYGLPGTPARYRSPIIGPHTPVRGCYLAGTDAAAHGIAGAMMGGVMAVAAGQGMTGFPRLMERMMRESPRSA